MERETQSLLMQQLLQASVDLVRFVILFSMIIPISWRISLDFAKLVYKRQMTSDRHAPRR